MSWRNRVPLFRLGRFLRQCIVVAVLIRIDLALRTRLVDPYSWVDGVVWADPALSTPVLVLETLGALQAIWLVIACVFQVVSGKPICAPKCESAAHLHRLQIWLVDLSRLFLQYAIVGLVSDFLIGLIYITYPISMLVPISLRTGNAIALVVGLITWHFLNRRFARRIF